MTHAVLNKEAFQNLAISMLVKHFPSLKPALFPKGEKYLLGNKNMGYLLSVHRLRDTRGERSCISHAPPVLKSIPPHTAGCRQRGDVSGSPGAASPRGLRIRDCARGGRWIQVSWWNILIRGLHRDFALGCLLSLLRQGQAIWACFHPSARGQGENLGDCRRDCGKLWEIKTNSKQSNTRGQCSVKGRKICLMPMDKGQICKSIFLSHCRVCSCFLQLPFFFFSTQKRLIPCFKK